MKLKVNDLLKQCEGVTHTLKEYRNWKGQLDYHDKFYLNEDKEFKIPKGLYVEVTSTATKGTIGKLIDFEYELFSQKGGPAEISTFEGTLIFEVEGRSKPGRISSSYADIIQGYTGETKWVRSVKKHKKKKVKNPVNKFKQELKKGDWVVGVKPGKKLAIGRITRWTNHNVWAVPHDNLDDTSREFRFDSIAQTFLMPNEDHVSELTMAVLKGWNGY
jgi:hypothetical protein